MGDGAMARQRRTAAVTAALLLAIALFCVQIGLNGAMEEGDLSEPSAQPHATRSRAGEPNSDNGPFSDPESTTDDLYFCPEKWTGDSKDTPALDTLPQLKIEHRIDTKKEREHTDVTLVTQLSFERLYMLEGQCAVWKGVISAAVYIALVDGKAVTVEKTEQQPRPASDAHGAHQGEV